MSLPIQTTLIWTTIVLITGMGMIIYMGTNRLSSRIFLFSMILFIIWSFNVSILPSSFIKNPVIENFFLRSAYYTGSIIAAIFYYFCNSFPEDRSPPKKTLFTIVAIEIGLIPLLLGKAIIDVSYQIPGTWGWGHAYGDFWFIFDAIFIYFWIMAIIILFKKYKTTANKNIRTDIRCMIAVLIVGFALPDIFTLTLPHLGYFDLMWLGPVSGCLWAFMIIYSIIRHHRMDIKTTKCELLGVSMMSIFLIETITNRTINAMIRLAILSTFLASTACLMKNVLNMRNYDRIRRLYNKMLKNDILTKKSGAKRRIGIERSARRESEKMNESKDQFISMTRHGLKGPLANIRCNLEAITKRYLDAADNLCLKEILQSTTRLEKIADEFLDIPPSRTSLEIMKESKTDMLAIMRNVLDEFSVTIKGRCLTVSLVESVWPVLMVDAVKLREVILIVMDNAIKYNQTNGTIMITGNTDLDNRMFALEVKNTGIGISETERDHIVSKSCFRGERARSINPTGMGIGLQRARSIMRAHGGHIDIISAGIGNGATVVMRLPIYQSSASTSPEEDEIHR